MKKIIISLFIMLAAVFTTNAQQTTVEGSRILDNTSISVYAGAMGWINPAVVNEGTWVEGLRPTIAVGVNKWVTPVVGAELVYELSGGSLPFNKYKSRYTFADYMELGLNAKLNLNNLVHHYTGTPDFVEVVPFAGLGWGHGFTSKPGTNFTNYGTNAVNFITSNLGAEVNFNLGEKKAWQINVRPSIHYVLAGEGLNVQFNSNRAYAELQAGLTYKFGHKNSVNKKTHNFTKAYTVAEYDELNTKYEKLKRVFDTKPEKVVVDRFVEKIVEKEVTVEKTSIPVPHFVQGQAVVDPTTLAVLNVLADEMKANDNVYVLTGYASEEGTPDYNKTLSMQRAEAIKTVLVNRGVGADRLVTVGAGATTKFGADLDANRIVVVEKK